MAILVVLSRGHSGSLAIQASTRSRRSSSNVVVEKHRPCLLSELVRQADDLLIKKR
jgi:hypothetical protein